MLANPDPVPGQPVCHPPCLPPSLIHPPAHPIHPPTHPPSVPPLCSCYLSPSLPQLRDCVSAESTINATHFEEQHRYGMWLEPNEWIAWYLDDVLLFNVTTEALSNKTNPSNTSQSVGPRTIPSEPMYLSLSLESSALPLDPALAFPLQMEVDWVRVYQNRDRHGTGCDPTEYPTAQYIDGNTARYGVAQCGNGACEAGECDQCPTDCREAAACRQDCRVPVCQARDGTFLSSAAQWALVVASQHADVIFDYRLGVTGAVLSIYSPARLTEQIQVTPSVQRSHSTHGSGGQGRPEGQLQFFFVFALRTPPPPCDRPSHPPTVGHPPTAVGHPPTAVGHRPTAGSHPVRVCLTDAGN